MNKSKLAYRTLTLLLLLVAAYLYDQGFAIRSESFGLGLSYVLPAITCFGLAVVTGIMAMLESLSDQQGQGA